jgi:hypothetical protein
MNDHRRTADDVAQLSDDELFGFFRLVLAEIRHRLRARTERADELDQFRRAAG